MSDGESRTNARRAPARGLVAAALVAAAAWCGGCSGPDAPPGAGRSAPADVYTVRGVVVELPEAGPPRGELRVRHEAIDDFRGVDGAVWGMDAMVMPFPLADALALENVEPGDKVEMTFEVDWAARPSGVVTAIRELPPETELEFREARPPAP